MAAQDPRHGPGRHAEPRRRSSPGRDARGGAAPRPGPRPRRRCVVGHAVRARGPVVQPGLALGGVPVDPGLHALAGDAHRRGDMGLLPAGLVPLDDQQPAVERSPSITVGHENLRSVWALDKPHPNRGFSSRQADPPLPTSWPGTPRRCPVLGIEQATYDAIVAHARRDHPDEACGVVAGRAGSRPPGAVRADAERGEVADVLRVRLRRPAALYREMDERDEEPVVIYHSHTATEAYPSRTDIALASEPGAHHVLVSTREPERRSSARPDRRRRGHRGRGPGRRADVVMSTWPV